MWKCVGCKSVGIGYQFPMTHAGMGSRTFLQMMKQPCVYKPTTGLNTEREAKRHGLGGLMRDVRADEWPIAKLVQRTDAFRGMPKGKNSSGNKVKGYCGTRDGYPVEWFTRDKMDKWMQQVGGEMKKWKDELM